MACKGCAIAVAGALARRSPICGINSSVRLVAGAATRGPCRCMLVISGGHAPNRCSDVWHSGRGYICYIVHAGSQERDRYKEIRGYHRDWGAARSTMRTKAPIVPPRKPYFLAARRPLLAASSDHGDIKDACNRTSGSGCAHRALSRQPSHAFITLDSQQGTSLSDSMACAAVGACLRQA